LKDISATNAKRTVRFFNFQFSIFNSVLLLLLTACARHEAPSHPPVILISIDTLRSDHLPAYGYREVSTPAIDGLAADGIVFERAFSQVPLTLPSHASIMTGLLPAHDGVRDNAGFVLDPKTPTIASVLKGAGYATGGAVSAYVLRATTNIGAGFDTYEDHIPFIEGAPTGNLSRPGTETMTIARNWIAEHAGAPFFAFVHLFEPHAPYDPTYDGEILKADALVGDLLQSLRERGLYDGALIVLLSDHGEGLRDHGEQEHGVLLYREALQVPLIVKLPRNERRGTRIAEAVQLVDVLPTIAAVTGAKVPRTDGHSLLAAIAPHPIFSETLYPRIHLGWSELHSVIDWPHHLIDGPKPELYDLSRDLYETQDLRETDRRAYARLRAAAATAPMTVVTAPKIDPEEAKKLAALGYVSAQPAAAHSDLNPREHLADLDKLKRVTELMGRHYFPQAAARIEDLLQRNPGWSDLRNDLGFAYEQMGDLAAAERTYRDAIRTTPELAPEFALLLAGVLVERGALDDAEGHARLALQSNPDGAHEVLARVALARGDSAAALREAELAHADFLQAQILLGRHEADRALVLLQRLYDTSQARKTPLPRGFFIVTGDTFRALGRRSEARDSYTRAVRLHPEDRVARERLGSVER
jgi:tetratricopeptide (TPR) repeat protein